MPNGGFLDASQETAPEVIATNDAPTQEAPVQAVPEMMVAPDAAPVEVSVAEQTPVVAESLPEEVVVSEAEPPVITGDDGAETAEERAAAEAAMEELPTPEALAAQVVVVEDPKQKLVQEVDKILSIDLESDLAHLSEQDRTLFLKTKPEVAFAAAELIQKERGKPLQKHLITIMLKWMHSLPKTNIAYTLSEAKEKALAVAQFAEERETAVLPH